MAATTEIDVSKVKVIAFDLFGTVFDMSSVPREEIRAYINHIEQPEWEPLELPKSWQKAPAFSDAAEGFERLFTRRPVFSLSNAPVSTQSGLRRSSGIWWNIFNLESYEVFKPRRRAYMAFCTHERTDPENVLMVTANPKLGSHDYGDCEMARSLGMQAALIRQPGCPQTIIELAELLEC